MSNIYQILDETEYKLIDSYQDCYKYSRKNKSNTNQKDNGNIFVYKNNICSVPVDYGEVICSYIARKTIQNGCNAVLTKRKINPSNPQLYEYGASSFYYKSEKDKLIFPNYFINDYFRKIKMPENQKIESIDICFNAIFHEVIDELKRPYTEFINIKQQYIDMIMFDCKFGNYDRGINNWCLMQDEKTRSSNSLSYV